MKLKFLFASALIALAVSTKAEVPPAEKLLPNDTLLLLTTPDFSKLRTTLKESPQGQLWDDPAMKPFKDKFMTKFKSDFVAPLEKELGVKFSDYTQLAQGQITFAVTQNGWQGTTNPSPGWILLLDAKDKSALLSTNLATLKKKWVDSGKKIKTEKLREVEFTTLITTTDEIGDVFDKVFPGDKADATEKAGKKMEIIVGQSGSLLLVGSSAPVIEKVLVHQAGAIAPSLIEEASYEANHNAMFRTSPLYTWINVKPIVEAFTRQASEKPAAGASENPLAPAPDKIISGLGLAGLKTIALSYTEAPEGAGLQLSVGIPEGSRTGIFKILTSEKMESSAPAFVPADVTKFWRWRLNLPKAWTGLENMLTGISPAFGGVVQLVFESAGKDKDPNFDLKKELLTNLGDDVISYQRIPANASIADLSSPPSVYLLGSPNAEKLAAAIKIGMSALSPAPIEERDFLGRKIYKLPPNPNSTGKDAKTLNFSASGGYLALSTSVPMLEEYLRSSETQAKSLSETVGLKEAAEKVDGTSLGLFGFDNQSSEMRATLTALKKESGSFSDLVKNPALGAKVANEENKINDWIDFSLLPPFESIAKYFHFAVFSGNFDGNGFTMKFFYPTPPALKK